MKIKPLSTLVLLSATLSAFVLPACAMSTDDASQSEQDPLSSGVAVRTIHETHELHHAGVGLYLVDLTYVRVTSANPAVDAQINAKLEASARKELSLAKEDADYSDRIVTQRVSFNRAGLLTIVQTTNQPMLERTDTTAFTFDARKVRGRLEPRLSDLLSPSGIELAIARVPCDPYKVYCDDDPTYFEWSLEPTGLRLVNHARNYSGFVTYRSLSGAFVDERLQRLAGDEGAR
jgi:hypothetical protein